MAFVKIVLLCIVLAVAYGIAHDLVTAHVCVEYFTIGHPYVIPSTSPVALALTWGVLATWWMGLGLGLLLAVVSRAGARPKLDWRALLRPGLLLLAAMGVLAAAAALLGRWLAVRGTVWLVGPLAEQVPAARHVDFLTCLWAHVASYAAGTVGGVVLALVLWRRRRRLARGAVGAAGLLLALLVLGGCLETRESVVLRADGTGRIEQTFTLDANARDELLRLLAQIYGAEGETARLPFADPFSPEWVRAAARDVEGFVLDAVERTVEGDRLTTRVEASFETLRAAAHAGAFFTASVALEPEGREAWKLTVTDAWAAALRDEGGELGGRDARTLLEALRGPLAGLTLERRIVLPTKVLETNGRLDPDGRTVTWSVSFDDLGAGRGLGLEILFAPAEGLELNRFIWRPDPDALLVRALEAPPGVPDR